VVGGDLPPARAAIALGFGASGEPIVVAGVTIAAGDIVVGDATGIVYVPRERATDVLTVAERIAVSEAQLEGQIADGSVVARDKV
jgi:4-hydroxy-4-methyl-2-oxoglutarate aldolase